MGCAILHLIDHLANAIHQIQAHAKQMLDRRNKSFKDIVANLQAYRNNISETGTNQIDTPTAPSQREILGHLIAFLESC